MEKKNAILKLAPKTEGFEETNLTVVTMDNVWYTFLLNYQKDIKDLTYFISPASGKKVEGALIKTPNSDERSENEKTGATIKDVNDEDEYVRCCREIIQKVPSYWDVAASTKKVYLALTNIMFIRMESL